ncbi:MAG: c-type cytochrome [Acidobacteriota bacterium]|nr:c-type cytochrome [Acidobacteriota bacterium]
MLIKPRAIFALAAAWMLSAGCRQDMHNQPKYKPLRESTFFADGRQSRPLLPNTVARGDLREATDFYTGKGGVDGKQDLDYFPIAITKEVIERGHQRFDAFCSPCHGRLGNGAGMIVKRGFKAPPSYHIERLRAAPAGHFYDVITNGYGSMYNYAAQIPPRDRWAIVSYIRALQYSQYVEAKDLTPEMRAKLDAPPRQGEPGGIPEPVAVPPRGPERKDSPNSPNLPPGAPATPASPTPGQAGAGKK